MTTHLTPIPDNAEHLSQLKYRPNIDGLRAIAVILVVGFHAFPRWVLGGFIGVDIFFVISGFLISTIIVIDLKHHEFKFLEFYIRRIKRIFPALLLVLSACFAFGWLVLFADEYTQLGKHIAGGAGFISNLVLWNESGYFDNSAETKPLLHLWSLGVEEQFYIIWPALLWFSWKKGVTPLTLSLVVGAASFALNIIKVDSNPPYAFYSPQTRLWELQVGATLAYLMAYKPGVLDAFGRKFHLTGDIQALAGLALIVGGLILISQISYFPGWWALLPTMGAALIILAGTRAWINRVILSNKVLVWIGLISYPLYLWHWPLLSFAHIIAGEDPSFGVLLAAVCASIVLAWLTYSLLERPIRIGANSRAIALHLVTLMFVVGLSGYAIYSNEGFKFRKIVKGAEQVHSQFAQGTLWKYTNNDICLERYSLKEAADYAWWFCMANKVGNPTLLLLGNSYANHLYAGLSQNPSFSHQSILSIGDCDPGWDDEYSPMPKEIKVSPCTGHHPVHQQQLINNIIEKYHSVKFVIINGLQVDDKIDITYTNITKAYILALKKRIDFLEKRNIKVIVFIPQATAGYNIKSCFARPFSTPRANCDFSLERYQQLTDKFKPIIQTISVTNPNVLFFDQEKLFCNAEKCSMVRNGMPLFRDLYNHLSEYGSIELASIFEKWARSNAPELLK